MDYEHINPWLHIWVYPKKTIRSLLDSDPQRTIVWLAVLAGILSGALFAFLFWNSEWSTNYKIFFPIGSLIGGGILGLISLYFEGWLYTLTGSWIGGKGSFTDLKCAVGWRNYPTIVTIFFNGVTLLTISKPWLHDTFGLIYTILSIWTFVILVNLIGEAHRFSAWKGLLSVLIAMALLTVLFMVIALIIPLLSPLFQ
jgi:hypothetical protein